MFSKALQMLDRVLTFFEEWSLFLIIMIALVSLILNLLLRHCINYTLTYSEDIARMAVIYITCIGCCYSVKNRSIIKMEAVIILWPKSKIPLEYFCHFATILFAALAVHYGIELAELQSRILPNAT
jgi:C4-dicarboxylate transporter, DctQ subunit